MQDDQDWLLGVPCMAMHLKLLIISLASLPCLPLPERLPLSLAVVKSIHSR